MVRCVFSTLILILLSGCSAQQKQIWLTEIYNTHEVDSENVIRMYLDEHGSIYPDHSIYIPYKDFFAEKAINLDSQKKEKLDDELNGNLDFYFTGRSYKDGSNVLCYEVDDIRSSELAAFYGIEQGLSKEEKFDLSQKTILKMYADSLNKLINKSESKTLLIFLSGFNDPNPTDDFQLLRNKISEYTSVANMVFLEIYWDGLVDPGIPGNDTWKQAQKNAMQAAVPLRKLLNELDPSTKIRIIGYSSGAIIGTAALFNCTSRWDDFSLLGNYKEMVEQEIPAPQHHDIRMAFLAPAIPGVETFIDFNQRGGQDSIRPQSNNISRIVIGYNCNDIAVTKMFPGIEMLAKSAGATSLGCDADEEINKTRSTLSSIGYQSRIDEIFHPVPFNKCPCKKTVRRKERKQCGKKGREDHSVHYYLQNEEQIKLFMDALFLD